MLYMRNLPDNQLKDVAVRVGTGLSRLNACILLVVKPVHVI